MICNTCGPFPNGYLVLNWVLDLPRTKIRAMVRSLENNVDSPMGDLISFPQHGERPELNAIKQVELYDLLADCKHLRNSISGTARDYLLQRQVVTEKTTGRCLSTQEVLFHPGLKYSSHNMSTYPALVACIRREGMLVGAHKTYLTNSGRKAFGGESKRIGPVVYPGATTGAAIQLFQPQDMLMVAEGIETSMAIYERDGTPIWAATCANGMAKMAVPDEVSTVIIFADNDRSGVGQNAADHLASRMRKSGKKVKVWIPERQRGDQSPSIDMLDQFIAQRPYELF
jgi:hypothetical protein